MKKNKSATVLLNYFVVVILTLKTHVVIMIILEIYMQNKSAGQQPVTLDFVPHR